MLSESCRRARTLLYLFGAAVAINYPWELAQAPLYEWPGDSRNAWWHCFVASLGDGVILLLIHAAGVISFHHKYWFDPPGVRGYLMMLAAGLVMAIGVE